MSRSIKFVCLIALILALVLNPAAISAQRPPTNLSPLAQADVETMAALMPIDSVVFFALRTDDNYIALLDSLLQKVYDTLPGLIRLSLPELLDQAFGGNFQTTIRAWLGDNAALAVGSAEVLFDDDPSNDFESEVLLAVQITDRGAVEALFESLTDQSGYTKTSTPAFTDYEDTAQPILLRVTENLLLFGTKAGVQSVQNRAAKLNANPKFQETVAALPAEDYNILLYLDLSVLPEQSLAMLPPDQRDLIGQNLEPVAIGATILDGRSLTLDFATRDTSERFGVQALTQPTDPAFARFMPANTILSLQLHSLKDHYEVLIGTLRANFGAQDSEQLRAFEQGLRQLESAIRLLLNLDLNDDILSWMTGEAALFVAYTPQERSIFELGLDLRLRLPFVGYDFGLLIEAADPDKAAALVAALATIFESSLRNDPTIAFTQGEGNFTLAFEAPTLTTPIELVIGATDSVFYLATGAAAKHVQSGAEGLSAAAGYREVAQYLLPESFQIWYMGSDTLNLIGEIVAASDSINAFSNRANVFRRVRSQWQGFAKLLSSSSISFAVKDGFQVGRAVITLPE